MITAVDNIGIAAANLQSSVAFYEKLGFTNAFANDRGCLMVAGSARLFVFPAAKGNGAPPLRAFDLNNPPGIDHISFLVDDVDRTYHEIRARGIEFESAPADQFWGARTATLRDPDGNNIYLLAWLQN
jgi:methylmalonyl-CoA/ethylmalonyl-CoA epimerase